MVVQYWTFNQNLKKIHTYVRHQVHMPTNTNDETTTMGSDALAFDGSTLSP